MKTLYTYGEIDSARSGKECCAEETKAYDNARAQARSVMLLCGEEDPDEADCPDDAIEEYADDNDWLFDKYGTLWTCYM